MFMKFPWSLLKNKEISDKVQDSYCSHAVISRGDLTYICQNPETYSADLCNQHKSCALRNVLLRTE